MKLVKNALILGVGYVIGAAAGRERYEQIKQQAQKLAQRPEVKQAGRRAQEVVVEKVPAAEKLPGVSGGQDGTSGGAGSSTGTSGS